MQEPPFLSIVLPVYNEEETLPELYKRLTATMESLGHPYELIFVDDGSQDSSYALLTELHAQDSKVHIVKLSRNFGHHIALTAGLDYADGNAVILMDADLQDQPEEIPKLLQIYQEGYDVVVGLRQNKKFSWLRRTLSSGYRWMLRRSLGISFEGGVFRILSRRVADAVRQCRESDRMLLGLIQWVGFRQTYIPVEHGERYAGQSKYSLKQQWRLARHALLTFSTAPLRLASWLGSLSIVISLISVLVLLIKEGIAGLQGWPALMVLVLFLGGVQLLCTGILGSYLARAVTDGRARPLYIVEEKHPQPTQPSE